MATNLQVIRGNVIDFTVTITTLAGAPLNLTGATAVVFTAKKIVTATVPTISLSLGNGITVVDAAAGKLLVVIPASATADLDGETCLFWDILVTTSAGTPYTPVGGFLVVLAGVST